MRLSTSTCIHEHELWKINEMCYTAQDAIIAIAEAGYKVMDMNFSSYSRENLPMTKSNWEDWVKEIYELTQKLGLDISQAHAHYYGTKKKGDLSEDEIDYHEELIRRSILGAGMMNIPWIVIHPDYIINDTWYSRKESIQLNLEKFKRYAELAKKCNVGIAIENMFEPSTGRRYCTSAEELLELIDLLGGDPVFGICWDFGHANMVKLDQCQSLRDIGGSRLKALHVNDNHGLKDEHIAPYMGTIQWAPIMSVLKEINYQGDFTYEIHNYTNGFPCGIHNAAMKFSYELGQYMLSL